MSIGKVLLSLAFLVIASPAWAVRSVSIPPSLEHDRPRIETAVRKAEDRTFEKCFERRYPKQIARGKHAKVALKCQKKINKIKLECVDALDYKCGGISVRGCREGGKKVSAACQNTGILTSVFVHEFCHVVAGNKSGHGGVPECAKK